MNPRAPRRRRAAATLLCLAFAAACLPLSERTQKLHLSGFLDDYSRMTYRDDRGGILAWERRGVHWIEYQRLMIDVPEIFLNPQAGGIDRDAARFEEMAQYFHDRLVESVEDTYPVVTEPGPDVLRIRCAITNVMTLERVRELRDDENYIVPVDIGGAGIEGEFLDSMSGKPLLTFVDATSEASLGGVGIYSRWEDARLAFDAWAQRFRAWLDYKHGLTNLPPVVR